MPGRSKPFPFHLAKDQCGAVVKVQSKRSRKSAPKSRKGCRTCKIRHAKCDEKRPSCSQCLQTNRICDFAETNPSTPLSLSHPKSQITPPPSLIPTHSALEVQNIDYFRTICVPNFLGFFQDALWSRVILQRIIHQPCIRHAASAVAAAHRLLAFPTLSQTTNVISTFENAFSSYTQAISLLNSTLCNDRESYELALFASLLFTSFEVLRGNETGAMVHIEAGFRIIKAIQHTEKSDDLEFLIGAFSRLDLQTWSFSCEYQVKCVHPPEVPATFSSMHHARQILHAVTVLTCVPLRLGQVSHDTVVMSERLVFREHKVREVGKIRALLQAWKTTFDNYLDTHVLQLTRRDHIAATTLRISHLVAEISIETTQRNTQCMYDNYTPQFSDIISLSETVISYTKTSQPYPGLRVAFDISVIQPLNFVALKCRDRKMRRRAIEIMEGAGREGVWDGKATAAVLRWVVEKEEEGLRPSEKEVLYGKDNMEWGDERPGEEKRFFGVLVEFFRSERRAEVRGWRRLGKNGKELEEVKGEMACWGPEVGVGMGMGEVESFEVVTVGFA